MLKSIFICAIMLLLLAGLTYSQDISDDEIYEFSMDENTNNPPYNPDWLSTDILVYNHSGNTTNVHRTLDMQYCEEDGILYLALLINITGWNGTRVYWSSNSGASWNLRFQAVNTSYYWTGISMTVDEAWHNRQDSVRVNLFVTRASSANNDNAHLQFYSFKSHVTNMPIIKTIASPTSGNEFAFPSAYSNGNFNGSGTDIGCIVGEYNNAGTNCIRLRKYYMMNWSWNFTGYGFTSSYEHFWPSAAYKNNQSGVDSVYIAVETRLPTNSDIRVYKTRAFGGGGWSPVFSTSTFAYNRRPCLAIQDRRYPSRMVVTYTQNSSAGAEYGRARLVYSYSGGASWSYIYMGSSHTTRYTWVSCDTNGTSQYCTFIWGDYDSLNVKRSRCSFSGGTYYYDRASYPLTTTAFPVCAVYNNRGGNHRRSVYAYWRSGPHDIYANAENLPTGITSTNGTANTYSLSQNFPNPFNPTTSINFSILKDGLVKLVVYDVLGKEVATLVNDEQSAGNYQVTFDASKLTSGVYFYKLITDKFSDVKKMVLLK
jgi:hypothetical protein